MVWDNLLQSRSFETGWALKTSTSSFSLFLPAGNSYVLTRRNKDAQNSENFVHYFFASLWSGITFFDASALSLDPGRVLPKSLGGQGSV